jgi:integrase
MGNHTSFLEEQQKNYMLVEDIAKDFLFNECGYTSEDINNSKSNGSKVKKITEILIDIIKDTKKEQTSQSITLELLKECLNIIPKIPMKPKNQIGSYSFYFAYKGNKNASKNELRAEKTIIQDLNSFFRFIKYLAKKKFINTDNFLDLETHLKNIKKDVNIKITNSEIREKKKRTAFKDEMLKKIFSKEYKPYSVIFEELANAEGENRDILLTRFLVPIVLFFTGARPAEITFLKTTDCEIQNIKGEERIILYLEANELKNNKTRKSKRIVIVHDFLAKELNFINFIKNAMKEKREFLFNAVEDFETKVSVGFNRDKDFLEGNISRIDDFNNLTYTLYSFRHTYKTHMLSKNISETVIDKIQGHTDRKVAAGYFSITEELINTLNLFDKHLIIDWDDIKIITNTFK